MTCILSLKRRISHMNRQENRLRNYRKKAKGFSIHILIVRNVFVILSEVCGNKELKSSHNYCKKAQDILTSQMKGYQSKRSLSYWTMSSSLIHNLNINQRKKMIKKKQKKLPFLINKWQRCFCSWLILYSDLMLSNKVCLLTVKQHRLYLTLLEVLKVFHWCAVAFKFVKKRFLPSNKIIQAESIQGDRIRQLMKYS